MGGFEAFEAIEAGFGRALLPWSPSCSFVSNMEIRVPVPWAVSMNHRPVWPRRSLGIFLGRVVVGFIYEWKKEAL